MDVLINSKGGSFWYEVFPPFLFLSFLLFNSQKERKKKKRKPQSGLLTQRDAERKKGRKLVKLHGLELSETFLTVRCYE